jgi:hypothetical protein
MVEALEETLAPRRRRALDDHLAACPSCRQEIATTERLFGVLDALPMEADVPARLEQATLRAVRIAAAEEAEHQAERAPGFRWFRVMMPAFAAAAAVAVAVVATQRSTPPPGTAASATAKPAPAQVAKAVPRSKSESESRVVAAARPAPREARPQLAAVPVDLPVELSERPDLLFALPMLHNLDKLEHFEKIETTVLDDDMGQPPGDADSNG